MSTNKPILPSNELKYHEALQRITGSQSESELKTAINDAVVAMKDFFESQSLENLKEKAIAMDKDPDNADAKSKFIATFNNFLYETAVEDGRYMANAAHRDDYDYAKKLRARLIKENKITSQTGMAIVDMAVISYFRYQRVSRTQIALVSQIATITGKELQPKVNLLKQLDKQIEASYRQFTSSITFLKDMRQPKLNVKIQSKETFVAQNQQINQNANDFGKKYE